MDHDRFDHLTRRLAAGATRRAALTGAAAGLLGALGWRRQAGAQVTQAHCGNVVCADNPGVCNAGCGCCAFVNGNSRCMPPDLCGRYRGEIVCPEGEVFEPGLGCVAEDPCGTMVEGAQCDTGRVCLDGACQGNGACGPGSSGTFGCGPAACGALGATGCLTTTEVGVICIGAVVCTAAQTCTATADCPEGFICRSEGNLCGPNPICEPVCGSAAAAATLAAAEAGPTSFER